MERYTVLNRGNYRAGHHSFGPVAIPVRVSSVVLRMARFDRKPNGDYMNEWPTIVDGLDNPQEVVRFNIDISQDGGVTWRPLVGGTAHGGLMLDKDGKPAEWSEVSVSVPQPDNAERRVRGWLDTYTAFQTVVELETYP